MGKSRDSLSGKQQMIYILEGTFVFSVIGFLFYRSIFGIACLCLLLPFYVRQRKQELIKSKKKNLRLQFREVILSVSGALQAGHSIENAFREAYKDICLIYGKDCEMSFSLYQILKGIDNNLPIEKLLTAFAEETQVDDISDFAEVFKIIKRNGGDITKVIQSNVSIMCEKMDLMEEITTILSAKQLEEKIMNKIPFLIILYIQSTSKGFFDSLYHNLEGVIIMSACLIIYGMALMMSRKIVDIRI